MLYVSVVTNVIFKKEENDIYEGKARNGDLVFDINKAAITKIKI